LPSSVCRPGPAAGPSSRRRRGIGRHHRRATPPRGDTTAGRRHRGIGRHHRGATPPRRRCQRAV